MSSINEFTNKKNIHHWPITLLRVYTGAIFIHNGFGKLTSPNFADGLAGFVTGNLDKCYDFMRPFLESVVFPNSGIFAFLVSWGEFLVGGALIVGLANRYASITGAFMVAVFWFTKGQSFWSAQNYDAIWLVIFVVLAAIHAGRVHSLDARLADRFRFLS